MTFPEKVAVFTENGGAYYTETFTGPGGAMPTWEPRNAGLDTLLIRQAQVDAGDASTWYVVKDDTGDLWRYNGTLWERIYETSGDAKVEWCSANPTTPGEVAYLVVDGPANEAKIELSTNSGASCTCLDIPTTAVSTVLFALGNMCVLRDEYIYAVVRLRISFAGRPVVFRYDRATGDWSAYDNLGRADGGRVTPAIVSPSQAHIAVPYNSSGLIVSDLALFEPYPTLRETQPALNLRPYYASSVWFDPADEQHQRLLRAGSAGELNQTYETFDAWDTVVSASPVGPSETVQMMQHLSADEIVWGRRTATDYDSGSPHNVWVSDSGYDGATLTARSGPDPVGGVDSIPLIVGGNANVIANTGIQFPATASGALKLLLQYEYRGGVLC